jgi:hypothetical protein
LAAKKALLAYEAAALAVPIAIKFTEALAAAKAAFA